jgi:hypothetical protein
MTAKTVRNVHGILSGAFTTARRWEWISWNPAESAKPPAVTRRPLTATAPEDVAKVIAEGRKAHPVLALYLWLVAANGVFHIAFNYVVVGGLRVRCSSAAEASTELREYRDCQGTNKAQDSEHTRNDLGRNARPPSDAPGQQRRNRPTRPHVPRPVPRPAVDRRSRLIYCDSYSSSVS